MTEGRIKKCVVCGWTDERGYNADCECLSCAAVSANHIEFHNGRPLPRRKPMARSFAPRTESTLLDAIRRRA